MQKLKDVKLLQQAPQQQHPPASFHIHPLAYPALPGARAAAHHEPLVYESKLAFLSKVLYNAWRMPWQWAGDPQQLGGELVFEPVREEKRIKRKPIKYRLMAGGLLAKANSVRSTTTTTSSSSSDISCSPFRRPSCAIKSSPSRLPRVRDAVKEIQVQCKFIHQMTNYQDHFSIDELMMMSGIRLTSLIQRF
ncbi:hypothetical protein PTTG_00556 [Puccinia triticina 1-1 BBBD Race 1]|uniref:Uncharacterized protein n=2 Tax=Puccinia triticina TaxID=208348 RepID=A0A180H4N2_PUCT1|nr:hypothetical protein PTTG_00556 [Puccinia triticina 1-1 BBBD Race 1]